MDTSVGKDVEHQELSFIAYGEAKWLQLLWKAYDSFLQNQTYTFHMTQ
jgi:hypothetical protein